MGLFDNQIRQRKTSDTRAYENAYAKMAGVVSEELFESANSGKEEDAVYEILRYYRIHSTDVPKECSSLNDKVEFLSRPVGIMTRRCTLTPGWFKDASGPMLGFLKKSGRAVAFLPRRFAGYDFYDPETGVRKKVNGKNESLFSEDAIVFYRPLPMRKINYRDIIRFSFASHSTGDRVFAWGCIAAAAGVQYILPKISKFLMSNVSGSGNTNLLYITALFLLAVSVSSVLFISLRTFAISRINNRSGSAFESAMVMRLLSLPGKFFRDNDQGSLNSRMYNVKVLVSAFNSLFYSSALTSLMSLVYIFQLVEYAPSAALPAAVILILQALVYVAGGFASVKVAEKQLELGARENSVAYSTVSGMRKIKLAGAERRMFAHWTDSYVRWARSLYHVPKYVTLIPVAITGLSLIGQILIYMAVLHSSVSVSDYYAFTTAYGLVSGAILALSSLTSSFSVIRSNYRNLSLVFDAEPEPSKARKMVTEVSGNIELDRVSFRYEDNMPWVLDELNLSIHAGEYVAIVGKTGCGKSTIMRILLGFETPDSGTVRYDGRDLMTLDLHSLRRKIGVVLQDGKLFQGDIYSNIVISAPWLSEEDAWKAAEMAGLAEDIRHMPMGMHTMITASGGGVSGGQKQRIMIARAIAAKPRILMFDEATSALDNLTQTIVSDSLNALSCTRIVIAHRLSTIRQCDRIIMLSGGHIIEDGTYEELIALNGEFADMVRRQQVNFNAD